jgi:hypothetical protein
MIMKAVALMVLVLAMMGTAPAARANPESAEGKARYLKYPAPFNVELVTIRGDAAQRLYEKLTNAKVHYVPAGPDSGTCDLDGVPVPRSITYRIGVNYRCIEWGVPCGGPGKAIYDCEFGIADSGTGEVHKYDQQ